MYKINFRGQSMEVYENERISQEERDPNKFYYEVRESDTDMDYATLEPWVKVNFWGTVATDVKLEFPSKTDLYINLKQEELDEIN